MTKKQIIVIGFSNCGTTSIAKALINEINKKQIHLFDATLRQEKVYRKPMHPKDFENAILQKPTIDISKSIYHK